MKAPIEYTVTRRAGRPYALVPMEQFSALMERAGESDSLTIPHAIVHRHLIDEVSLLRAWREHLELTQAALAERMGVSQAAVAQWERPGAKPRHASLSRAATALGIHVSQLTLAPEPRSALLA